MNTDGHRWLRGLLRSILHGLLSAILGVFSVSVPARSSAACTGDCDGDGGVTIGELVLLVDIASSGAGVARCPAGDVDGNGAITIDELITAVSFALNGCPATPTVTPNTPTAATTPTDTASPAPSESATPLATGSTQTPPSPTPSPTDTAEPPASPSATLSAAASATASTAPSRTPTATESSTRTTSATPSPSATPSLTATFAATRSPTRSATPTRTASHTTTSTSTATPPASATATRTFTPTRTATATRTTTQTRTATSTATPTPGLGVRRFSLDPQTSRVQLLPDVGTFTGFSGSLDLAAGVPDPVTGLAVVDVVAASDFLSVPVGPFTLCIRPIVPVSGAGVLACNGGFDLGVSSSQDHNIGTVGVNGFTADDCTAAGGTVEAAADPHPGVCNGPVEIGPSPENDSGVGALLIAPDARFGTQGLPAEATIDFGPCSQHGPGEPAVFGFVSGVSRAAILDANDVPGVLFQHDERGERFSCPTWMQEDGPGQLVLSVPAVHGSTSGDLSTVFVLDD